jgi:uncharacterized protein YcfL
MTGSLTPSLTPHTTMKLTSRHALFAACAGLLLLAGCATEPGPYLPQDTTKFTVENTEKFVLLDKPAQYSVTCTGLQERVLPDGRLEVVANVKNRENRRLQVQINCVFKDAQGFSTGDETPYQNLVLAEHETEAVRFTAANQIAKRYTIRVRQAR